MTRSRERRTVASMRDYSDIDRELSLLRLVRQAARELSGEPTSTLADGLLDERAARYRWGSNVAKMPFKRGTGRCPKCGETAQYELIDMTGTSRVRVDRLWKCGGHHRETHVDER